MVKEKKLQTIVNDLRAKGHQIKYYKRKDGGIVVTNIDGVSFKGKTGNAVARQIAGEPLSQRREAQLKSIRTPKKQFGNKPNLNKPTLPKEIVNQIKRINRSYSKQGVKTRVTTKKTKQYMEEQGMGFVKQALENMERKGKGKIFAGNLYSLIERLQQDNSKLNDYNLQNAINKLKVIYDTDQGAKIDEVEFEKILENLYSMEQGNTTDENGNIDTSTLILSIENMIRRYKGI